MHAHTLDHLSDAALLRDLSALVVQDRITTATLLAHIAEVDARRLFVPAGSPSMFAYCVEVLRLSEDAAYKRIQAARTARRFPALLDELTHGRLHLTAICLLAPHLTPENSGELMAAAVHRRNDEIRRLLALRFPGSVAPVVAPTVRPVAFRPVQSIPSSAGSGLLQLAPEQVAITVPRLALEQVAVDASQRAAEQGAVEGRRRAGPAASAQVHAAQGVEFFRLQVTIGRGTHDKLRHAQGLLGHAVPSGDIATVLDRALDALIEKAERRKVAAVRKPRPQPRTVARGRHVPAAVRRAVWTRDQGRCTFVGTTGHRCAARKFLEFDHVDPVARGGKAHVERIRLRCRAHNQFEAERTFGSGFMERKRSQSRPAAADRRANTVLGEVPSGDRPG
ncbi:MAG: hypothetical protein ABIP29_01660, partial [Candidatus Eisenbacteria bacterium]